MDYSPLDRVQAPLVFGVTGHRDLRAEDIAGLEARVREILLGFRKQYPATPFILLSPLAEGADRLVARVALEQDIRARLVVPLPMPQSAFEADFTAAGSLAEFHELLGRADDHWPLDTVAHQPGPERDLQYEAGGKYIARECEILIALWDGVQSGKVGGTAAIVRFQTEGVTQGQDCDLTPPELFPVYHIVTPRVSNAKVVGEPLRLMVKYPPVFKNDQNKAQEYYARTFHNLDEFNGYIRDGGDSLLAEAAVSKGYVSDQAGVAKLAPEQALTLDRYAIADALAQRRQKRMLWTHRALHWLVLGSFVSFVLFAHMREHPVPALVISFVLLIAGILIYRRAKRKRLDNKSLDYRAMAEACRVRFFWQIGGIEDSVADNYIEKQRTELDWIRYGLRGWTIGSAAGAGGAWASTDERLSFIMKHWVQDQANYFKGAAEKRKDHSESMELWAAACLYVALGIAIAVLAAGLARHHGEQWWKCPGGEWLDWFLIGIDAFLAGAALLHHANQRRAHSELRKQYDRMKEIFDNASRTIQVSDFRKARKCLLTLGRAALEENGDWVLLHRERPLELPHP
jgi:hypothetical protein